MNRYDGPMPGWLRSVIIIGIVVVLIYGGTFLRAKAEQRAEKRALAGVEQAGEDAFNAGSYPDAESFYAAHTDDFASFEEAEIYYGLHAEQ